MTTTLTHIIAALVGASLTIYFYEVILYIREEIRKEKAEAKREQDMRDASNAVFTDLPEIPTYHRYQGGVLN